MAQDTPPLTPDELKRLREIIEADDHATWLRRQIKVIVPWMFAVVAGVYTGWGWLVAHIQQSPPAK